MTIYLRVDKAELDRFTREVFVSCGMSPDHAILLADNLVQGELHGLGSHGVSRLLSIYTKRLRAGGMNPRPEVTVVRQRGSLGLVDGDGGPGAVAGDCAMRLALDLCREHGSGWVAARNSSHFGAAFLYAREAIPLGMIGFASTAAVPMVLPYGGKVAALGTNPLCVAVPGGERGPIILDMATSVVARGKVQLAVLEGKDIPLGWAVDAEGRPTTDALAATKGAMLPLGAYKGYGLAVIAEVFSSVLSGAAIGAGIGGLFTGLDQPQDMGHFFGAMDIAGFMPLEQFQARMDELIAYLKSTPLQNGFSEILIAGEPEARKAAEYSADGIPIAEDVVEEMQRVGEELGVAEFVARVETL